VESGSPHIREASEWPKEAPEPGGWISVDL